jgi:TatA/E family protein of Tat protein translocase
MDFFGIGPVEVLLVLVIAFIIFGPKRLLEMSRKAGKVMGDLTRSVSDLNEKVNEELKEIKPPVAVDTNKSEHIDSKEMD